MYKHSLFFMGPYYNLNLFFGTVIKKTPHKCQSSLNLFVCFFFVYFLVCFFGFFWIFCFCFFFVTFLLKLLQLLWIESVVQDLNLGHRCLLNCSSNTEAFIMAYSVRLNWSSFPIYLIVAYESFPILMSHLHQILE